MDDFDVFASNTQEVQTPVLQNTNIPDDDFFGGGNTSDITAAGSTDIFSNDQQEDSTWVIENDSNNTTRVQSDILGDDTLGSFDAVPPPPPPPPPQPEATSFDDDMFANQLNTDVLDSYDPDTHSPSADDTLFNDTTTTTQQSVGSSSFDMFSNPVSPSTDTKQFSSTETSSTESSTPLQAFNIRRQKEIAEKDAEENRKIDELRQQAKQDLDRFYNDRQTRMEQKRVQIKQDEDILRTKALEKSDKQTCDWAKVIRFVEFTQGTQLSKSKRDLNRMKSCIVHAKRDKDVIKPENGV